MLRYSNKSIYDIAEECGYNSAEHFIRQFKKVTGMTVANYILKTRIVMAQGMLQNSDATIGEVSEKCGFSGVYHFSRAFKQRTGQSPTEFIAQNKTFQI